MSNDLQTEVVSRLQNTEPLNGTVASLHVKYWLLQKQFCLRKSFVYLCLQFGGMRSN